MPCLLAAGDVDIADVDGDAQERRQLAGAWAKNSAGAGRLPVGDDDGAALRRLGEVGRVVEHLAGLVEAHVAQSAQRGEGACAVVIGQHVGRMGQQNGGHGAFP